MASSAVVARASKPIYAKKTPATPLSTPDTPFGANGDQFSGRIVFDLDEAWDFEMLDGSRGKTDYMIPFRSIARIIPENRKSSTVEMKNGRKVRLEGSQDVTRDNDGILVFATGKTDDPVYIRWEDVREIAFN